MKTTARILYDEIRNRNSRDGIYVWVDPDESSLLRIQTLMEGAPFKIENTTEYHTTVLFHEDELPFGIKVPIDRPCNARITEFVLWDDDKGQKIIVALLDSPDLQMLHTELVDEGLMHSFPDYNPHITLGKRVEMNAQTRLWLHSRNEYLSVADFDITFDPRLKASSLAK